MLKDDLFFINDPEQRDRVFAALQPKLEANRQALEKDRKSLVALQADLSPDELAMSAGDWYDRVLARARPEDRALPVGDWLARQLAEIDDALAPPIIASAWPCPQVHATGRVINPKEK